MTASSQAQPGRYCAHPYTRSSIGKTYVCVSRPHLHKPDGHHFVEVDTTPSSTAAYNQHLAANPRRPGSVVISVPRPRQ